METEPKQEAQKGQRRTFESSDSLRIDDVRHPTISVASQLRFLLHQKHNRQKSAINETTTAEDTKESPSENPFDQLFISPTGSQTFNHANKVRIRS